MPGKSLILDTSVIIDLFSGERKVAEKLSSTEDVFIPSIVVGSTIKKAGNPHS